MDKLVDYVADQIRRFNVRAVSPWELLPPGSRDEWRVDAMRLISIIKKGSAMNTEDKIEITGVDLREFVKEVYALSKPQGMGIMHFKKGDLSDEDAAAIVAKDKGGENVLYMDYVHGRACKMSILRDCATGKLYIHNAWYDHTWGDLKRLLAKFNIDLPKQAAHPSGWGTDA